MLRQKAKLPARTIFGSKKRIRIELKAKFLEPADPTGYTTFTENFNGARWSRSCGNSYFASRAVTLPPIALKAAFRQRTVRLSGG